MPPTNALKPPASTRSVGKKKTEERRRWTKEEFDALNSGVRVYGHGNWSLILLDEVFGPVLKGRSNANLKDKWRQVLRRAGIDPTFKVYPFDAEGFVVEGFRRGAGGGEQAGGSSDSAGQSGGDVASCAPHDDLGGKDFRDKGSSSGGIIGSSDNGSGGDGSGGNASGGSRGPGGKDSGRKGSGRKGSGRKGPGGKGSGGNGSRGKRKRPSVTFVDVSAVTAHDPPDVAQCQRTCVDAVVVSPQREQQANVHYHMQALQQQLWQQNRQQLHAAIFGDPCTGQIDASTVQQHPLHQWRHAALPLPCTAAAAGITPYTAGTFPPLSTAAAGMRLPLCTAAAGGTLPPSCTAAAGGTLPPSYTAGVLPPWFTDAAAGVLPPSSTARAGMLSHQALWWSCPLYQLARQLQQLQQQQHPLWLFEQQVQAAQAAQAEQVARALQAAQAGLAPRVERTPLAADHAAGTVQSGQLGQSVQTVRTADHADQTARTADYLGQADHASQVAKAVQVTQLRTVDEE